MSKSTNQKTNFNSKKFLNEDSLARFILLIATIIMFWQQLSGNAFFWEDFVEYVYPVQNFAAAQFDKWIIPFWNPYSFNGMPFLADMQVGFFYPITRLLGFAFFSDGQLSVYALQLIVIFHIFIANLSMFRLARYLKISTYPAVVAALSFGLSFIMIMHTIHPMMIFLISWFPQVLYYYLKGLDENRAKYGIFAGLLFGMSLLAGHPQITLYLILFLGLVFVWKVIFEIKEKQNKIAKFLIAGIIPFAIAAGIFQIQYLPTQELADLSQRAEMTYEASAEGSLEFKQLFTAFAPNLFGYVSPNNDAELPFHLMNGENQAPYFYYWETGFYFGIIAIIFGLFAVFTNYKDKTVLFLLIISIFGFLYALGDNFFLHKLMYNLPLFGGFRNPARMMLFPIIGFSLLAGFGIDQVIKSDKKQIKLLLIAAGIPLLIGFAIAAGLFTDAKLPANFASVVSSQGIPAIIFSILALVLAFLALTKKINLRILGITLVIITAIDLISAGKFFNESKTDPAKNYQLDAQTLTAFTANPPKEIFRINSRMYNPSYMAMNRNIGLVKNIMLVEGYNPLVLKRVTPPLENAEQIHDALNVKYELAINPQSGQPFFAENQDRLPRAWMVHDYKVFNSEDEIKSAMSAGGFDISKYAALEQNINLKANPDASSPTPEILEYSANEMKIKVNAYEDGLLCLSEIYYPAWKAQVDGIETEILNANYALRAIQVSKGEHIVELKYQSSAFSTGLWITFGTILLSIAGIFLFWKEN